MAEERKDHLVSTRGVAERIVDDLFQGQTSGHFTIMHDDSGREIVLTDDELPVCRVCGQRPYYRGHGYKIELTSVFQIVCEICAVDIVDNSLRTDKLSDEEVKIIERGINRLKTQVKQSAEVLDMIRNWRPPTGGVG